MNGPLLLAHRGDHRSHPENSLAAFGAAVAAGCDGVELDVRGSGDGEAVVIHDATLERVQRLPARVSELTAAELAAVGVPTLLQVLSALPFDLLVDVELKERVDAALGAIRGVRGGAAHRVVVSSFDRAILQGVADLEPTWARWLNATDGAAIADAASLGCQGIAIEWRAISPDTITAARDRGLTVVAWTVREPTSLRRVAGLGVDAVCVEGSALETT